MPSLKDFIEAMSASWPVALTILIGTAAIIIGDAAELPQLAMMPNWVAGTAFIVAAFAAAILVVSAVRGAISLAMAPVRDRRQKQWMAKHLGGVDKLPPEEMHVLAWAVACRTQIISAPYFDARTKALTAKAYLQVVPGQHHTDNTPFKIPGHIWDEISKEVIPEDIAERLRAHSPFSRW